MSTEVIKVTINAKEFEVPKGAPDEQLEPARQELERRLAALESGALAMLGRLTPAPTTE